MTDIASRSNTLNLFGGVEKDQLFRLQANDGSSTLQTAHPLVLGAESVKIVNASGAEIADVVTKFSDVYTAISNEVSRATAVESTLTSGLDAEVTRATSAEATLSASILAETTRATNAEAYHRTGGLNMPILHFSFFKINTNQRKSTGNCQTWKYVELVEP